MSTAKCRRNYYRDRFQGKEFGHIYQQLSDECRDSDLLLKDMRSAMFHVRVGQQVLEENNRQPFDETVGSLVQYHQALIKMTKTAIG